MGWNSWCTGSRAGTESLCNAFGKDPCSETQVREVADAMVEQGMTALGYTYVNLDDCWSATNRSADGELQPDTSRFPSGIAALADYVHSRGLLLGLYTDVGTKTCKGDRPGSFGHYAQDAKTLARWGVDFVKMDHCGLPSGHSDVEMYTNMSVALNATGRSHPTPPHLPSLLPNSTSRNRPPLYPPAARHAPTTVNYAHVHGFGNGSQLHHIIVRARCKPPASSQGAALLALMMQAHPLLVVLVGRGRRPIMGAYSRADVPHPNGSLALVVLQGPRPVEGLQACDFRHLNKSASDRFQANNASDGVGLGQGTADIIEFMASLQPSRWTQSHGWVPSLCPIVYTRYSHGIL